MLYIFRGATYYPLSRDLKKIRMLLLAGSRDIKQFIENDIPRVVLIGGNDPGSASSQPGRGSIMESGL